MVKDKVLSHLKDDIKTFHREAKEDKELIQSIRGSGGHVKKGKKRKSSKGKAKISKVMREFKHGKLHSGSKKGPKVKSRKQAVAIALSKARKAGAKIKRKK